MKCWKILNKKVGSKWEIINQKHKREEKWKKRGAMEGGARKEERTLCKVNQTLSPRNPSEAALQPVSWTHSFGIPAKPSLGKAELDALNPKV